MQDRDSNDDELARRLEAYAEARLSPELSATTRMRAKVMAAAHRNAALAQADRDRAASEAAAAARADRTRRTPWRRSMTLLLAAGLTLAVGVGTVAAAQPGGPLYPVRIWTETLTLPSEANARAQAELKRLEDRLTEAAAATAAGDTAAAAAALEAYDAIIQEATDNASGIPAASATLDDGVRRNIEVLEILVDRQAGHGQASESIQRALQRAIDRSDSALDKLHGKPAGTPGGGPPTNPGNGPDVPDKTDNPNKPTPDPVDKTQKPHPTPKPKADETTPAAQPPPAAEHTPGGGPPSEPPGNAGGGGNGNAGGNGGGGNGNAGGNGGGGNGKATASPF